MMGNPAQPEGETPGTPASRPASPRAAERKSRTAPESDTPAARGSRADFAALDVETANPDPASICQIGIAIVNRGQVARVWTQLVRPAGRFDRRHVAIHGIRSDTVADAPCFADIHAEIARQLPEFVVTHTRFDVGALTQACRRSRRPMLQRIWLDSSRIPAIAWPGRFPRGTRGLRSIADRLGIQFRHHDAGEDARAAAEITLLSLAKTGERLDAFVGR